MNELLDDGPREVPWKKEWFIAKHIGRCHRCEKKWPKGAKVTWLWNPDKTEEDDKDFKVHYDCWYDAMWYWDNGVEPPGLSASDESDIPVLEDKPFPVLLHAQDFDWALEQLLNGRMVRREHWSDRFKLLKIYSIRKFDVIFVQTTQSRRAYTFPRYDTEAGDWVVLDD